MRDNHRLGFALLNHYWICAKHKSLRTIALKMLCLGSTTDMHKDMLFARQPMKLETGKQSHHVLPGDGALVFSKLGRTVHSCHARSNQTLVHRNRTYSVTRHRNIVALHDIEATLAFFEKPWKCTVKFSTT